MKKIYSYLSKGLLSHCCIIAFFLLILLPKIAQSQVINEGFEEAAWSTGLGNSTSGSIVITATSANSTMSYMSVQGQTSFSTAINTVANKGTWFYSKAGSNTASKLDKAHSKINSVKVSASGYIITPVTPAAVVSITFWASIDGKLTVGMNTDTNAGQPTYSSNANAAAGYTYATQSFSSVGNSSMTSYSYTGTFSGPCRIGFFNPSGNSFYIDDIIVSGPIGTAPTVSTNSAIGGINTANVNSTVNLGLPAPSMPLHSCGVIWGTTNTIDITSPNKTINQPALTGTFPTIITGLTPGGTQYYARAYVKALDGQVYYGAVLPFITLNPVLPTLTTTAVVAPNIFSNKAYGGGQNIDSGGVVILEKGVCWNTTGSPVVGVSGTFTSDGVNGNNFSSVLKILTPNTTYKARAYARNSVGVGYGNEVSFTTTGPVPTLSAIPSSIDFGSLSYLATQPVSSYTLYGSYLNPAAGSILVTAPAGYKVSTLSNANFNTTAQVNYTGSTIAGIKIYVQMATDNYGTFAGNIIHTGGGTIPSDADTVKVQGSVIQDPNVLTNSGTDFWTGFGYQEKMSQKAGNSGEAKLSVYISVPAGSPSATVKIELPGIPGAVGFPKTITVLPNTVTEVTGFPTGDASDEMNPSGLPDTRLYYTGKSNRGIHIYSTNGVPVSTWMHSYTTGNSAAGAMLFPTNTWNSSYTVQAYGGQSNNSNPNSFFFVVANEDNTPIWFTPSNDILDSTSNAIFSDGHVAADVKYQKNVAYGPIYLNKGQIFNAMGFISGSGSGIGTGKATGLDLTGTTVKTDCSKKIAVFAGNGRCLINAIGCSANSGSDHMIQQMFPKVAWGTKYLTVPTKTMEFNVFRINVDDPTTNVWVNNPSHTTPLTGIINNLYYEVQGSSPNIIESDKPINVTQFIVAGGCANQNGSKGNGDPEMVILSPMQQAINKTTVFSAGIKNPSATYNGHYINVIIKKDGIASFKLDNASVADTGINQTTASSTTCYNTAGSISMTNAFVKHPGDTSYYFAKFKVSPNASHSLFSDYPFNAIAYGMGDGESYGYNAGTAIKNLSSINVAQNPFGTDTSTSVIRTCKNNPVTIKIALPYLPYKVDSIVWNPGTNPVAPLGAVRGPLTPDASNPSGFSAQYSGTILVDGQTFYLYTCPVSYTFSQDGTFHLKATAYGTFVSDCGGFSEKPIDVMVGHDDIIFTATPGACGSTAVTFNNTSTPLVGTTMQQWNWTFGDGTTYSGGASTPNPTPNPHVYPATSTGVTSYWAKLETRNSVGCTNIDSVFIDLSFNLKAKFVASLDTICENGTVVFTDQSTSNATEWTWNWGDGTPNTVVTGTSPTASVSHTFNTPGTFNVKLFVKNAAGCTSTTVDTNIVVIAKPVVDFQTPPGICLGGSMQFTNLTTPTTGVTYAWNFNDPNATGSNPNTSTVQNPTHTYTSTGPFSVTLVVTNSHYGCSATKIKALSSTIYQLPTAIISAPTSACLKDTVQFTDASTPGTNNTITAWAWTFGDGGTSTQQNPKHPYFVLGNQSVTLTVTNDKGCVNTTTTPHTINIKPLPNVVFSAIPNICLNASAVAITQATETTGMAGASPSWVYTGTGVAGNTFTPTTAGVGTFPIIATYNAANGCKDADTMNITVMPLPTVAFTVGTNTCEKTVITFTDNSTPNAASIQSWGWNFSDAPTSSIQNPTHNFYTAGNYTVTLTVTNSNNCTASLPKTVTVHSRPFAEFTMPASVCLPDGNATFTNLSTVADDANPSFAWSFGNPNNATGSTIQNPTHQYSSVGPFTVQLTVTSQFGCVKDTTHTLSTVHPEPLADFTTLPTEVCLGDAIAFTGQSASNAVSWDWAFADGSTSTIKSPAHTYGISGPFNVVYFYTDAFGCKSQTVTKPVIVNPYPVMDAGPNQYVLQGNSVEIKATASGANLNFKWTPFSPSTFLNYDTVLNPICTPTTDELYTLRVTNAGGCYKEDTVRIFLLKEPEIPNAFSPNGDGINDKWEIGQLNFYSGCTVEIFNRNGQKLFNSVGYSNSNAWDGTVNGKPLPVGTYYYIINPKNGHKIIGGSVTILR